MGYTLAYFSTKSETKRSFVHVCINGKPICGSQVKGEYQFCARLIIWEYIECEKCKKKVKKSSF